MGIPLLFVALASLVCFILVLIKQFQNAGAVHGIVGIVSCGIWTFIWGWINSGENRLQSTHVRMDDPNHRPGCSHEHWSML